MNGVGGDLFAIYWDNKAKKLYALNASGWSPAGWSLDNLKAHNVTRLNGIWSVTVPGTVAGWQALHDRFGKLSLAEDLKPAEALAEKGFPMSEANSAEWEKYGMPFVNKPEFSRYDVEGKKWVIEGHGVDPDIVVDNDPAKEFAGIDEQLEKGIEVILEELKKADKKLPDAPPYPKK